MKFQKKRNSLHHIKRRYRNDLKQKTIPPFHIMEDPKSDGDPTENDGSSSGDSKEMKETRQVKGEE